MLGPLGTSVVQASIRGKCLHQVLWVPLLWLLSLASPVRHTRNREHCKTIILCTTHLAWNPWLAWNLLSLGPLALTAYFYCANKCNDIGLQQKSLSRWWSEKCPWCWRGEGPVTTKEDACLLSFSQDGPVIPTGKPVTAETTSQEASCSPTK